MNPLWGLAGAIVFVCAMLYVQERRMLRRQPPRFDDGMLQQMLGDAKAEGYAEGDRHGYMRGKADGVKQEREEAEWRANAIQQLIDTTKERP